MVSLSWVLPIVDGEGPSGEARGASPDPSERSLRGRRCASPGPVVIVPDGGGAAPPTARGKGPTGDTVEATSPDVVAPKAGLAATGSSPQWGLIGLAVCS